jgi:hypothetical protein
VGLDYLVAGQQDQGRALAAQVDHRRLADLDKVKAGHLFQDVDAGEKPIRAQVYRSKGSRVVRILYGNPFLIMTAA